MVSRIIAQIGGKKTKEDTAMRKYISIFMTVAMVMASCAKEQPTPEEVVPQKPETTLKHLTFTGITDDGLTKTTLGSNFSILWSTYDHITVFPGTAADGVQFDVISTEEDCLKATFDGTATASATYYALSPAQAGATIADGKITASLPTTQTATIGSYASEANVSVATANNYVFQFKNVGALVQVTIDQDDITGIKLEAIGGEQLSGSVTINPADGNITNRNGGESYVQLTGTFAKNNTYYFVILPGIYSQGFRITLNKGTQYASITRGDSKEVCRNYNFDFGTVHGEKWKTAFTAGEELVIKGSAEDGQTFAYVASAGYWDSTIQYSDVDSYAYEYEIFTSLTADQKFYFHAAGGENYTLNAAGTAVERLRKITDAPYGAPATGEYRIRLNMTNGAAEIKQISEVKYDLYGLDSRALSYQGGGVWNHENFWMRTGGDYRDRYRFLVKFTDNTKQYYGRMSSITGNPTYGTTSEDYFYVQPSTDQDDHWSPCFKFESTYAVTEDRYYCTMTLALNNDNGHYTHAITDIWDKQNPLSTGEAVRVYGSAVASPDSPGVQMRYSTAFYNGNVANSGDRVDGSSTMADPDGYDYEVFVQLTANTKFYFSTESGHHFAINSTGDGIEGVFSEDGVQYAGVGQDGVYRIRIKSSNNAATLKRAESVRYLQPDRGTNEQLTYMGNGVWEKSDMPFGWTHPNAWGNSERFKFKFQIYYNETSTWQYYGRYEIDATYTSTHIQPITDTYTLGSWYNFLTVEGNSDLTKEEYQTEYGYCNMSLKLNADGYTYEISNIRQ